MACATTRVPSSRNLIQTFHSPPEHLVKFFGNHRLAQQNTRPFVAQSVQNEDLRDNTGSFVMQSHSDLSLPPPEHLVHIFGNHRLARQNSQLFVAQSGHNKGLHDDKRFFVAQSHLDLSVPPNTW
ncbi:unnamed protein product [Prunus armeniaca]